MIWPVGRAVGVDGVNIVVANSEVMTSPPETVEVTGRVAIVEGGLH